MAVAKRGGRASAIAVRRVLTKTPLARRYERFVDGGSLRRPKPIPWNEFERDRYPAPALALAAEAMKALAFGEYDAVGAFVRLAGALVVNGAPFDVVAAATEIPADEIRHSDYALRFAALCVGDEPEFHLPPSPPVAPPSAVGLSAVDLMMLELPVISETLAAAMLSAARERASDPVAKAFFSSVLADEVHHLRLGWYYFAWRAPQWTRAEQQLVSDRAGELVVQVDREFQRGRDAPPGSRQAARALGVLDTASLRRAVRRAMEREILPGLDALGLGTSEAWRIRARVE